jgi:hypothetical protein
MENLVNTRREGTTQAYPMISDLPAYKSTASEAFSFAAETLLTVVASISAVPHAFDSVFH